MWPALTAAALALAPADGVASALAGCKDARTKDAASECMIEQLGKDKVLALRIDRQGDPAIYRAVGLAFALDRESAPVAADLAASGLYEVDLAPQIMIMLAQKKAGSDQVNVEHLRMLIAMIRQTKVEQQKNWPPASIGKRVDLSRCPDGPQRRAADAACVELPAGGVAIVRPLPPKAGWLVDYPIITPGADAPQIKKAN